MKVSLAVHLHLFYTDMWANIRPFLNNIDFPYDLYVTLTEQNESLIQQIKNDCADAKIFVVENRGYDIGPFMYFLNQIDLDAYDFILKIHTKNFKKGALTVLNHRYMGRKDWFYLLMDGVLGSKQRVENNLAQMAKNSNLGMIGSKYLITSNEQISKNVRAQVVDVMQKLGFPAPRLIKFVAGTMFLVRSRLLKALQGRFLLSDFEETNPAVKDGTLAHALERVFGCLVEAQGYEIKGWGTNLPFEMKSLFFHVGRFLYQRKVTQNKQMLIKVCKIPVYRRKLI